MAGNMFLKIETPNVEGEVTDKGHEKEVQVISWSHSFNQPTAATRSSAGGGTVEKANHADFTFTKFTDSSTDDFMKACWNGDQFAKATFTCYRADGENNPVKYLEVIMENIIVSNVSLGGGTGDIPVETIAFNYGVVSYNYVAQKPIDGTAGGNQAIAHNLMTGQVS